ncbi:hypothetical protein HN51_057408 [Arachis hypogaea]|uniref:uncharacterized protein n=1 Tax=Arachis hypogaea TaxID=3818 RepID=UPI0007AEF809|nr:uncharacterized protein LOC107621607 isoform X2 [Arachis ipaensis]XP_025681125.1 uncharacterized protein LOC112782772 isoform X1 [Arachis hypogaea]XP_025681126.1 uncharacterized protein LOC112782772 isoform X1 [Arachis hypogaea]QHN80733.1 Coiled-coil domain-containing protein [Arachis hypogaea]
MAAACKRLAQLSGFGSKIFNSSLRLFSAKGGIGDTTAITRELEEQGLPKRQAEAITAEVLENFQESSCKRAKMILESNQSKFEAEVQRLQMEMQREIEKLRNNMEERNSELRDAMDKAKIAFKAELKATKNDLGIYSLGASFFCMCAIVFACIEIIIVVQ